MFRALETQLNSFSLGLRAFRFLVTARGGPTVAILHRLVRLSPRAQWGKQRNSSPSPVTLAVTPLARIFDLLSGRLRGCSGAARRECARIRRNSATHRESRLRQRGPGAKTRKPSIGGQS